MRESIRISHSIFDYRSRIMHAGDAPDHVECDMWKELIPEMVDEYIEHTGIKHRIARINGREDVFTALANDTREYQERVAADRAKRTEAGIVRESADGELALKQVKAILAHYVQYQVLDLDLVNPSLH